MWVLAVLILMAVLLVGLGVFVIWQARKKGWEEHQTDYRTLFWMGLIWVVVGGPLSFFNAGTMGLFGIGLVFFIVGLVNRDKWGKKQKLTPGQRRIKMVAILIGLVVLLLGILAFFMFL
jgi:hypothetical protein